MASEFVKKKRSHCTKSYEEKLEIIRFAEENRYLKQRAIAERFQMKPQTLSDLLRNKESIKAKFENRKQIESIFKSEKGNVDVTEEEFVVIEIPPECSQPKRKLSTRSFQEKLEIIKYAEENPSLKQKAIAAKFNMKPQTLSDLLKNKEVIKARSSDSEHMQRNTRRRKITHEEVDKALNLWLREINCSTCTNIDGETLRQKACYFAKIFASFADNISNDNEIAVEISPSWIERFKKRHGIGRASQSGGHSKVVCGKFESWFSTTLPSILDSYTARDIYCFDETCLLWSLLPMRLTDFRQSSETEHEDLAITQDEQITLLIGVNMDGSDKVPLLIVGPASFRDPFRIISSLPITYTSNRYALMTRVTFMACMRALDNRFQRERRQVALILEMNPAHPPDGMEALSNIKAYYLPSDSKCSVHPLRAGLIRELKSQYRMRICGSRLLFAGDNAPFNYDMVDAIFQLIAAWKDVSPGCIAACFAQAGLQSPSTTASIAYKADTMAREEQRKQFGHVWERFKQMIGLTDLSFEDFVNVDEDIIAVQGLTEEDIIELVSEKHHTITELDDLQCPPSQALKALSNTQVSNADALEAVNTLRRYWMTRGNLNELQFDLQDVEDAILSYGLVQT